MAKGKTKTLAHISAKWTKDGPVIDISSFENLSPMKIEKCFGAVLKEWYRLRSAYLIERRKHELEERTGVENG